MAGISRGFSRSFGGLSAVTVVSSTFGPIVSRVCGERYILVSFLGSLIAVS